METGLTFWSQKLGREGGHFRFLLLGQGPVAFAHAMQAFVQRHTDQMRDSATSKIERRVSTGQLQQNLTESDAAHLHARACLALQTCHLLVQCEM